jgi:hypothetical protein
VAVPPAAATTRHPRLGLGDHPCLSDGVFDGTSLFFILSFALISLMDIETYRSAQGENRVSKALAMACCLPRRR